jgi:hypothetical protein
MSLSGWNKARGKIALRLILAFPPAEWRMFALLSAADGRTLPPVGLRDQVPTFKRPIEKPYRVVLAMFFANSDMFVRTYRYAVA